MINSEQLTSIIKNKDKLISSWENDSKIKPEYEFYKILYNNMKNREDYIPEYYFIGNKLVLYICTYGLNFKVWNGKYLININVIDIDNLIPADTLTSLKSTSVIYEN